MSELTKRMSECDATDWAYRMREGIDRIDKLEECLREFYLVVDQVTPDNRERVFQPSIMAAYDKARALLEESQTTAAPPASPARP